MKEYKYLIIGGGMAGGNAVNAIRQADRQGSLALITEEPHRPYERPPLSKDFLKGKADEKSLYLKAEEEYAAEQVDLYLSARVVDLDPAARSVTTDDNRLFKYEKLLLATGGHARRLSIAGNDLPGVFTLRSIEDSKGIRSAAGKNKRVLVIGGGFIGSETAASLAQLGAEVTMVFPESRLMERVLPEEMSNFLQDVFKDHGVHILPKTVAEKLEGGEAVQRAVLNNGEPKDADMVVMGVGIALNTSLAERAGLELTRDDKAVVVDETLRTNDKHIYAAGDIASWPDKTFNQRLRVEHWDVARRQGLLAGKNMAGENKPYNALPYFFSDLFDLSFDVWGNLSNWEHTVMRGSLKNRKFAFYFFHQNRLAGVLAVGRPAEERMPMQTLVRARPAYEALADDIQNEDKDLAQLAEKMSAGRGEEEKKKEGAMAELSFKKDIVPLFREKDVRKMKDISGFDLSDYKDVQNRAQDIYSTLVDGSMPCDGPWPEEKVNKFKQWMDQGMKE